VWCAVLSNSGHGGAMAEKRGRNLKKCHQIAVVWRVTATAMAAMAE